MLISLILREFLINVDPCLDLTGTIEAEDRPKIVLTGRNIAFISDEQPHLELQLKSLDHYFVFIFLCPLQIFSVHLESYFHFPPVCEVCM